MNDQMQNAPHDNTTPNDSYNGSLRRQEFVNYLDSEINHLRGEIQRPGWTKWAFLVSLATLVWFLLNYIELGGYSLRNIIGLLLVISLLIYFYWFISYFISVLSPNGQKKVRFFNISLMNGWGVLVLLFGQFSFLIFVALSFSEDVGTLVTIGTCIFWSLFLLVLLLFCILVLLKFPIPNPPRRRIASIVIDAIVGSLLLFVIWRYIEFFLVYSNTSFANIRLALLIAAVFYIILMLARVPRGNLILDSLIMTRRQFALGEINLDTARIQTDIALTGLRAHDVLEGHVSKLLALYREASTELQRALHYLDDIEILYHGNQNDVEEQSSLVRPLLESLDSSVEKAQEIVTESIPKTLRPLQMRVFWVSSQAEISDTVDDLNRKLGYARQDVHQHLENVRKKLKTFMDAHNIHPKSGSDHP